MKKRYIPMVLFTFYYCLLLGIKDQVVVNTFQFYVIKFKSIRLGQRMVIY